ncbi:hypothetical protein Bca4012_058695 [Brassica carinata]
MNHNCHLASLQMVAESVGLDAWESIKTSSVGVIVRLKEMDYTWSARAVHHLLTNQLVVDNIHELWSLIEGQPIRFSLFEFGEITGLNCEPFDINDKVEVDHKAFWEEIGVSPSHGPMLSELRKLFPRIRNWPFEKRRMFGLLCVLSIGILGISPGSRIPLEEAKRVLDAEAFERYPWGRVGFSSLVNSVKVVSYEGKKKYTLHGCVHALLIWLYESIPGIGHEYGNHIEGNQVPLLSWSGSRCRIQWDLFYKKEKKIYGKVRVRHLLVVKAVADIYPQWDDDQVDDDLHNLILDILHEQIDDKHWSLKATNEPVANKRKRNLSWMVQDKTPYDAGAAVQCVVRKKANKSEVKLTSLFYLTLMVRRREEKIWQHRCHVRPVGGITLGWTFAKRKPQLTKTQVYPYVGNSTVKRIIPGDSVSKAHYDPLAKVSETKFKKLLDYLRCLRDDNDVDTHFYMKLITPRNDWAGDHFGWLTDSVSVSFFSCINMDQGV